MRYETKAVATNPTSTLKHTSGLFNYIKTQQELLTLPANTSITSLRKAKAFLISNDNLEFLPIFNEAKSESHHLRIDQNYSKKELTSFPFAHYTSRYELSEDFDEKNNEVNNIVVRVFFNKNGKIIEEIQAKTEGPHDHALDLTTQQKEDIKYNARIMQQNLLQPFLEQINLTKQTLKNTAEEMMLSLELCSKDVILNHNLDALDRYKTLADRYIDIDKKISIITGSETASGIAEKLRQNITIFTCLSATKNSASANAAQAIAEPTAQIDSKDLSSTPRHQSQDKEKSKIAKDLSDQLIIFLNQEINSAEDVQRIKQIILGCNDPVKVSAYSLCLEDGTIVNSEEEKKDMSSERSQHNSPSMS